MATRTRTRKAAKNPAPAPKASRPDKAALAVEDQVYAALAARRTNVDQVVSEYRTVGSEILYCSIGELVDGSEILLLVWVFNPHGELVATVAPTDAQGVMWRHRTTRPNSVEVTRHVSLLDAVHGAWMEAAERGAWDATGQDAVAAAYEGNPRKPLCEACGR